VTSQKIFDLLRAEQRAAKATVIMVSSDLDRLLTVTDRIGMMLQGRLIFEGTTEEAKTSSESPGPPIHPLFGGRPALRRASQPLPRSPRHTFPNRLSAPGVHSRARCKPSPPRERAPSSKRSARKRAACCP